MTDVNNGIVKFVAKSLLTLSKNEKVFLEDKELHFLTIYQTIKADPLTVPVKLISAPDKVVNPSPEIIDLIVRGIFSADVDNKVQGSFLFGYLDIVMSYVEIKDRVKLVSIDFDAWVALRTMVFQICSEDSSNEHIWPNDIFGCLTNWLNRTKFAKLDIRNDGFKQYITEVVNSSKTWSSRNGITIRPIDDTKLNWGFTKRDPSEWIKDVIVIAEMLDVPHEIIFNLKRFETTIRQPRNEPTRNIGEAEIRHESQRKILVPNQMLLIELAQLLGMAKANNFTHAVQMLERAIEKEMESVDPLKMMAEESKVERANDASFWAFSGINRW